MAGLVQTPVNYRVMSGVVLNGGSYPPPYRIINLSLKATVYASGNPGMQPGQGTVINPGTSLQWTRGGDLFLVLGNDTLSTDAGFADITLSYDVADWQPNPVSIAAAALNRQQFGTVVNTTDANSDTGVIDGSLFSSLVIRFDIGFLALANYPVTFQVIFFPTQSDAENFTNQLWADYWSWDQVPANNAALNVTIPLRSPYFRIRHSMTASGGNRVEIRYALSTMYLDKPRYELLSHGSMPNLSNNQLLLVSGGAVAIGGNSGFFPLTVPYGGDIDVMVRVSAAAACNGNVRISFNSVEYDIRNLTAAYSGVANNAGIAYRIALPTHLAAFRLVNNNAGAVAWTAYQILVTAVDSSKG